MLVGSGLAFGDALGGAQIMSGRECGTVAAQNHHADCVVGFGAFEGLAQFHEHPTVLGVARLRPVQGDACDAALFESFVADVAVTHGDAFPGSCRRRAPDFN